jgi:hypothetical protein
MAKNGPKGGGRKGAVRQRSQVRGSDGGWIKRDKSSGKFMDRKSDAKPFKGVRREK